MRYSFKSKSLLLTFILVIGMAFIWLYELYQPLSKDSEDYKEIFLKHQDIFKEISQDLISQDYELNIYKDADKVIVDESGIEKELDRCSTSDKTKENIKNPLETLIYATFINPRLM